IETRESGRKRRGLPAGAEKRIGLGSNRFMHRVTPRASRCLTGCVPEIVVDHVCRAFPSGSCSLASASAVNNVARSSPLAAPRRLVYALPMGRIGLGRSAVVVALGFVQILAWGSSFYLPAVLAPAI